jgi:hypothetical protein
MSGVRCFHVSIDEMAALNDRLAFTLRSLGLNDHELDEAIAASLHPALRALENSRRNANRRDRV